MTSIMHSTCGATMIVPKRKVQAQQPTVGVHRCPSILRSLRVSANTQERQQTPSSKVGSEISDGSQTAQELNCVSTGMDVSCSFEDDGRPARSSGGAEASTSSVAGTDHSAAADGLLQQLLAGALLISPFFFWGTSMVAMKGLMPHTTPLFLGSIRLLPAGLLLVLWAQLNGRKQPATPIAWAWILAFAVVDGAAFQGFLAEGLLRTTAGLGSVIIDSQPLTVAVLAALLFGERLGPAAIAGLGLGIAGLLLLELPQEAVELAAGGLLTPDGSLQLSRLPEVVSGGSLLESGEFYMLLAAQSMAVGTVMVRYVTKHCDPVMATGWHMVLGGAMLLAAAVTHDASELPQRLAAFNGQDALAMTYVSLLGGAASYGIFFYNASKGNLTALSSLTFLTPVFAAGGGYLVLNETLTPLQLVGAAITLSAVFLINRKG